MTDIVERLKKVTNISKSEGYADHPMVKIIEEAADEIERLRLSLSEARATGRREGISEEQRLRKMVERRDEFIISRGLWEYFKEAKDAEDKTR